MGEPSHLRNFDVSCTFSFPMLDLSFNMTDISESLFPPHPTAIQITTIDTEKTATDEVSSK
jgi:hypothetical protein